MTSIGSQAFADDTSLTSITSLGHIQKVRHSAFWGCTNLETAALPQECEEIEHGSFYNCENLTSVTGLNHVSIFGERCFMYCSKLVVNASDLANAEEVGKTAFWYALVTGINCQKLTSLGASAFRESSRLTSVECLGKISAIPSNAIRWCVNLETVKIPYECTSIGESAFYGDSKLRTIKQYNKSIDSYVNGETKIFNNISRVTSFGNSCFEQCSLL